MPSKVIRLLELLELLGSTLRLVQTEANGTRHYKDDKGNRLILYRDESFEIEGAKQ